MNEFQKAKLSFLLILLACGMARVWGSTPVMIQDFENVASPPTVWVVNIPNENASVGLSADHPHDGKQCLKLHYHFVSDRKFQYLGIPNKVGIQTPVHKLRFWLGGDGSKCSYGVRVTDASGETHQYSKNTGQGGIIDFTGWKEVVIDLDGGHETWGGDKNGRIDYPITEITFNIGQPTDNKGLLAVEGDLFFELTERRLWHGRGPEHGRQDFCDFTRVLLGRAGKHHRHSHGPGVQERNREMLEARRGLRV